MISAHLKAHCIEDLFKLKYNDEPVDAVDTNFGTIVLVNFYATYDSTKKPVCNQKLMDLYVSDICLL